MSRSWMKTAALPALLLFSVVAPADFSDTITPLENDTAEEAQETGTSADEDGTPEKPKKSSPQEPTAKDSQKAPQSQASGASSSKKNSPSSAPKKAKPQKSGGLFGDDITEHDDSAPIEVEGDLVTGVREKGVLNLVGNVKITQDDAKLTSDKATVFSEPGTTRAQRALARGNVKFKKKPTESVPPLRAEADELEYFVADRRIRLFGKPRVWRGAELIQGKEIFVELDTGAVTIKGARGIVEPENTGRNPQ